MKKMLLLVFALVLISWGQASADLISFSNGDYFRGGLGWDGSYPDSTYDTLKLTGLSQTNLSVSSSPVLVNLSTFVFTSGLNSYSAGGPYPYTASWDMTVNGTTKPIGQDYTVTISYSDTLAFLAPSTWYFDLGSGNSLKVDLLGQSITTAGIETGNIQANLQVLDSPPVTGLNTVPEPVSFLFLGFGLIGMVGAKRKLKG